MNLLTQSKRQQKKSAGSLVSSQQSTDVDLKIAKASWNDNMRKILIDSYVEELRKNEGVENGLKLVSWNIIRKRFNEEYGGMELSSDQVSSQWSYLKSKWCAYHSIINSSGFGWDHSRGVPECDSKVWKAFCATNKKMSVLPTRRCAPLMSPKEAPR